MSFARLAAYTVSPTCRVVLCQGDLTRWPGSAIVNAANERMLGGGGVDGAIHRAAGPQLRQACEEVEQVAPNVRCPTGEARITPGFDLPAAHVIHTVGPIYSSKEESEPKLRSAYTNSLRLANEHELSTVAFPAISCGVFGYPEDEAASAAYDVIKAECGALKEVHFVLFGDDTYEAFFKTAESAFGGELAFLGGDADVAEEDDEELAEGDVCEEDGAKQSPSAAKDA